jgi:hypothetical protein
VAIVVSPFTTAVGKKNYTVREPQVRLSSAVDINAVFLVPVQFSE